MPDDDGGAMGTGGLIPYFFYNVFAHIIPGGFVLAALILLLPNASSGLIAALPSGIQAKDAPIAIPTISFLVFLMCTEFIGFFLGAISYSADYLWCKAWPYSFRDLRQWTGGDPKTPSRVETAIHTKFDISLIEGRSENNFEKCSFLCWNFVAAHDPDLVAVVTKWDAEALLSRSVFAASTLLGFWAWRTHHHRMSGLLAVLFVASFFSFKYHRRKRVYGRLSLFDLVNHDATDRAENLPADKKA